LERKKSTWRSQIDFKDAIASKKLTRWVLLSAPFISSLLQLKKILCLYSFNVGPIATIAKI